MKVIFGAIYAAYPKDVYDGKGRINDRNPWDQYYGQFVPALDERNGKIYMIDTYKIDDYRSNFNQTVEFLKSLGKSGTWAIAHARHNYFYNCVPELTKKNEHLFQLLCNLDEFMEVTEKDWQEYEKEDRIEGIKLNKGWRYPAGSYLVRKGAEKSDLMKLKAMQSKLEYQLGMREIPQFNLDSFEDTLDRLAEGIKDSHQDEILSFKKTLSVAKKYNQMVMEFQQFCESLHE